MKVDFKTFTTEYVSQTNFNSDFMFSTTTMTEAAKTITNTFTPEDIELSETLYCLWIAVIKNQVIK